MIADVRGHLAQCSRHFITVRTPTTTAITAPAIATVLIVPCRRRELASSTPPPGLVDRWRVWRALVGRDYPLPARDVGLAGFALVHPGGRVEPRVVFVEERAPGLREGLPAGADTVEGTSS